MQPTPTPFEGDPRVPGVRDDASAHSPTTEAVRINTSSLVRQATPVVVADDVTAVLHQAGRVAFGVLGLAAEVLVRALTDSAPAPTSVPVPGRTATAAPTAASDAADVVLGLGWRMSHWANDVAVLAFKVTSPAVRVALNPPLVPTRLRPRRFLRDVAATWVADRPGTARSLSALSASIAPVATEVVGGMVDRETLWPRAFALLDLNRALDSILAELDLDHLVDTAVSRLDLERAVRHILEGVDVTALVEEVLRGTDLSEVAEAAFEQLDLTSVVLQHVDVDRLAAGILTELDLTRLVVEHVDMVSLANAVVDGIDLPQIVRESSSSVTAETVDSVRLQGIDADRAVAKLVDRMLMRGRHTR
jgi:hypothetical protein